MVRVALTPQQRRQGEELGRALRTARGTRSIVEVAAQAGISAETLRKIETGRIATPAFFTVCAIAAVLDADVAVLAGALAERESAVDRRTA